MVTPAMTKTETTATFFIPSSSASPPPPPSVAFKNTFSRSTNYPGEVWGLNDKCRQLCRPKKLPETLRTTSEAQAKVVQTLGESESLDCSQPAPGE